MSGCQFAMAVGQSVIEVGILGGRLLRFFVRSDRRFWSYGPVFKLRQQPHSLFSRRILYASITPRSSMQFQGATTPRGIRVQNICKVGGALSSRLKKCEKWITTKKQELGLVLERSFILFSVISRCMLLNTKPKLQFEQIKITEF